MWLKLEASVSDLEESRIDLFPRNFEIFDLVFSNIILKTAIFQASIAVTMLQKRKIFFSIICLPRLLLKQFYFITEMQLYWFVYQ